MKTNGLSFNLARHKLDRLREGEDGRKGIYHNCLLSEMPEELRALDEGSVFYVEGIQYEVEFVWQGKEFPDHENSPVWVYFLAWERTYNDAIRMLVSLGHSLPKTHCGCTFNVPADKLPAMFDLPERSILQIGNTNYRLLLSWRGIRPAHLEGEQQVGPMPWAIICALNNLPF